MYNIKIVTRMKGRQKIKKKIKGRASTIGNKNCTIYEIPQTSMLKMINDNLTINIKHNERI